MVTDKMCDTCEHYDYREGGYCWKIHETMYEEEVCPCWEPAQGDWVRPATCMPKDGEVVEIWTKGKCREECTYHEERNTFEGVYNGIDYKPEDVSWWMRFPEVPKW